MKRLVVGLTGGLGSGKSTVLAELKRLGAVTADADEISRRVVEPGGPAYARVARLFGKGVVRPDGALDRKALAARVFASPVLRRKLEGIIHPLVRREMRRVIDGARRGVVVLDIPLLYESRLTDLVERVLVVWAPYDVRYRRLMDGGRFTCRDIRDRVRAQMPLLEKRRRADDVVDNGGSRAGTLAQVRRLWASWRAFL
jgi:dephospho-CoA kinase